MKRYISICFFALFILNAQPGFSQKEIEIGGKKYLEHKVKKNETIYSLSRQYNVTQEDLKKANPGMNTVLKTRSRIIIPIKEKISEPKPEQAISKNGTTEPEFYFHKVSPKQTIFSISKQYGISADELIRFNPEIASGLQIDKVLKIPVKKVVPEGSSVKSTTKDVNAKFAQQGPEAGFLSHTVAAGETVYSLSKKYGITREELIRLNPGIENGLPTGAKLIIPQKNLSHAKVKGLPASPLLEKYIVQKGETLFSLANRFGVEVSDLKKANPSLYSKSVAVGDTILIPRPQTPVIADEIKQPAASEVVVDPFAEVERADCNPIVGANNQKYKVALLMPFYLQGNDQVTPSNLKESVLLSKINLGNNLVNGITDSLAVTNGINIDQRAEGFLEFYQGALLALDSLQQNGMNIELCVFDASSQSMILALLQLDVFRELDLIIGPVYPELQHSVASFAAKNRIPMVSPLAPTGTYEQNNPYFFKVNPTREYVLEQTANYVAGEFRDKNFVLLPMNGNSNTAEAKLAELGKQKLLAARQFSTTSNNLYHEYSFQKQGLQGVKPLLDEVQENIFMIPSDNEAQVSVAVTNLNAIAESFNVVLMGTSSLIKMKSIQTENYHHTRLRYLSPTFVDYSKPLVRRFVTRYRETFLGEPTQFSHQGYDVTYYFLSALYRYGKDFRSCLPQYPMELTQMNFHFRKVTPMGGYMNKSLFVTAYERNYDILNYGTLVPNPE